MDPNATHSVELSGQDLMLLRAGLKAYLREFDRHRQTARGGAHPEDEWRRLQRQAGRLIWRLETAGVEPGTTVMHSDEAVDPDVGDG